MRRWIGLLAVVGTLLGAMLAPARVAHAWGPEGHRVIALTADHLLQQGDPAARAKLTQLLATDKGSKLTKTDIASEATWADVLREKSEEAREATSAWHSVRLKPDNPDLSAACFGRSALPAGYPASHGPRENCVVDKVLQFGEELKNPETTQFERLAAVQFLLNLVGDLHDPLHAIDYGDRGGECTALQIGDRPSERLSTYWETTLVTEAAGPDPGKGAARLLAATSPSDARNWEAGTPESWAQETYDVAKGIAYGFASQPPAGKHTFPPARGQTEACPSVNLYRVGPDYESKAAAAVRMQLERAGVRLARVLRDGFK